MYRRCWSTAPATTRRVLLLLLLFLGLNHVESATISVAPGGETIQVEKYTLFYLVYMIFTLKELPWYTCWYELFCALYLVHTPGIQSYEYDRNAGVPVV